MLLNRKPKSMKALINLKTIISKQLHKMPKEYIVRLVLDRNHESMIIVKKYNDGKIHVLSHRKVS